MSVNAPRSSRWLDLPDHSSVVFRGFRIVVAELLVRATQNFELVARRLRRCPSSSCRRSRKILLRRNSSLHRPCRSDRSCRPQDPCSLGIRRSHTRRLHPGPTSNCLRSQSSQTWVRMTRRQGGSSLKLHAESSVHPRQDSYSQLPSSVTWRRSCTPFIHASAHHIPTAVWSPPRRMAKPNGLQDPQPFRKHLHIHDARQNTVRGELANEDALICSGHDVGRSGVVRHEHGLRCCPR